MKSFIRVNNFVNHTNMLTKNNKGKSIVKDRVLINLKIKFNNFYIENLFPLFKKITKNAV